MWEGKRKEPQSLDHCPLYRLMARRFVRWEEGELQSLESYFLSQINQTWPFFHNRKPTPLTLTLLLSLC